MSVIYCCGISRTNGACDHAVPVDHGKPLPSEARSLCGVHVWTLLRIFGAGNGRCGTCARLAAAQQAQAAQPTPNGGTP